MSRVAIVAEYSGHAFSSTDIADGGRVPSDVIQSVFHSEFRIRFQYFRLGTVVIPHQIRPNKFIIEPFESVKWDKKRNEEKCYGIKIVLFFCDLRFFRDRRK